MTTDITLLPNYNIGQQNWILPAHTQQIGSCPLIRLDPSLPSSPVSPLTLDRVGVRVYLLTRTPRLRVCQSQNHSHCLDPRGHGSARTCGTCSSTCTLSPAGLLHSSRRDPLRDKIREVGRGLSLADTQTGRYVRLYSRRRLCARRVADAKLLLRILLELVQLLAISVVQLLAISVSPRAKSLIRIPVPVQYRLSRCLEPIPNRYTAKAKLCFCKNNKRRIIIKAYSGGVLARALPEGLRHLST